MTLPVKSCEQRDSNSRGTAPSRSSVERKNIRVSKKEGFNGKYQCNVQVCRLRPLGHTHGFWISLTSFQDIRRPHQESNLEPGFRRPRCYPLHHEGWLSWRSLTSFSKTTVLQNSEKQWGIIRTYYT